MLVCCLSCFFCLPFGVWCLLFVLFCCFVVCFVICRLVFDVYLFGLLFVFCVCVLFAGVCFVARLLAQAYPWLCSGCFGIVVSVCCFRYCQYCCLCLLFDMVVLVLVHIVVVIIVIAVVIVCCLGWQQRIALVFGTPSRTSVVSNAMTVIVVTIVIIIIRELAGWKY